MNTPSRSVVHPRVELVRAMERIYRYRMTTTSGGNLSVRDDEGSIWITPARIDKGALRTTDVIRVDPDGVAYGPHRPSSELPFHREIYRARPDIGAIVHAHPVALVAFSLCGAVPDTAFMPKAHRVCGKVAFAPYELPGSEKLGAAIARAFATGADCVVLENHGVVVAGKDLRSAFDRFETLEFTAKTLIKAAHLGAVRSLDPERLARVMAGDVRWVETFSPSRASCAEREARHELAEFVRRGYRQRLMTSTSGSFSARVSETSFVITPGRLDRQDVAEDAMALVDLSGSAMRVEAGKVASRATAMHAAIYRAQPHVRSVVNAQPVNATAYACSDAPLDARTIPESYIFLRDVKTYPLEWAYTQTEKLAAALSATNPVCLIEHNGAVVAGTSILDAFDRLEVLETTAEALINAHRVGKVTVMSEDKISELRKVFLGES